MMPRFLAMLVASLLVAALVQTVGAQDKTHEGMVVSVADGKLVMSDKEGKNEHTHMVGATTKVTLDGKAAKLADLKKGDMVKVTTDAGGKVSEVDATRGGTKK